MLVKFANFLVDSDRVWPMGLLQIRKQTTDLTKCGKITVTIPSKKVPLTDATLPFPTLLTANTVNSNL